MNRADDIAAHKIEAV